MKKFVFAVHNHQPVGNFDHVIRQAFELSYKPFIDLVFNLSYPRICFHFSGILYEWLEKNFPQYLDIIAEMVKRGQAEILGGGYYEPILSVIPSQDVIEQVKKLSNYIYKRFGKAPSGLWLTERVYNPKIVSQLVKCGIRYIVVDDTHLFSSGIKEEDVNDIFITENDGDKIYVFTINHNLRYLIPYREPYKTVEYINQFRRGIFVMADDGEKFGLWPKSYKLVYEDGWLKSFFETIKGSDIKMKTFSECLSEHNFKKRLVYIPTTSYFEMTEWALEPDSSIDIERFKNQSPHQYHRFIRGGIFENFFTKYYTSNMIHKRVYELSSKLNKNYTPKAADFLYKAECNCGWWHGVFGGVYLPHIRHAIYENLLECQKRIFCSTNGIDLRIDDIDFDDKKEIEVETENSYFIISPSYGGSLVEFSSKRRCVNYSSVMSRFPEAYHKKEIRDINGNVINNINTEVFYDWHERRMLLDHFISNDTTIDMFLKARYPEQGDFIPQEYKYSIKNFNKDFVNISLLREGTVWYNNFPYRIMIEKDIYITNDDGFDVRYLMKNNSDRSGEFVFLSELAFGFSSESVAPLRDLDMISQYIFYDSVRGNIKLEFSTPLRLWIFPLFTSSNSEGGIETTYQGSVIGCILKSYLNPHQETEFWIKLRVL